MPNFFRRECAKRRVGVSPAFVAVLGRQYIESARPAKGRRYGYWNLGAQGRGDDQHENGLNDESELGETVSTPP
jgi:hypothetical protein